MLISGLVYSGSLIKKKKWGLEQANSEWWQYLIILTHPKFYSAKWEDKKWMWFIIKQFLFCVDLFCIDLFCIGIARLSDYEI